MFMRMFLKTVIPPMLILLISAGSVLAEDGPSSNYLFVRGGPGWAGDSIRVEANRSGKIKFESEYDINVGYGHYFCDWFRLEPELGYVHMKVDKMIALAGGSDTGMVGEDKHYRAMLNAYVDWKNKTAFTPFAGGGIGLVWAHHDTSFATRTGIPVVTDHKDTAFGWQLMGGVNWALNESWKLDLMFRHYQTNDRDHSNDPAAPIIEVDVEGTESNFLELGIRYCF